MLTSCLVHPFGNRPWLIKGLIIYGEIREPGPDAVRSTNRGPLALLHFEATQALARTAQPSN